MFPEIELKPIGTSPGPLFVASKEKPARRDRRPPEAS
jgi:hypothetical protein